MAAGECVACRASVPTRTSGGQCVAGAPIIRLADFLPADDAGRYDLAGVAGLRRSLADLPLTRAASGRPSGGNLGCTPDRTLPVRRGRPQPTAPRWIEMTGRYRVAVALALRGERAGERRAKYMLTRYSGR